MLQPWERAPMESAASERAISTMTGICTFRASLAPAIERRPTATMMMNVASLMGISGQIKRSDSARPKA